MVVLVLAPTVEKSLEICRVLEEELNICAPVQDIQELTEFLEGNRGSKIDLLLCDYFAFGAGTLSPYEAMASLLKNRDLPFIFYNDPMLPETRKADFWEDAVRRFYPMSSSLDMKGKYRPFFMLLNMTPRIEEIMLQEDEEAPDENEDEAMLMAAGEAGVTDSRLRLLEYFVHNRNRTLRVGEICAAVWESDGEKTRQMLYTYVSNLRQSFLSCMPYDMKITRQAKNSYVFTACRRKLADADFSVRDFLAEGAEYDVEF